MAPWVYNEKFLTGMQFLFGTLSFMVGEDDDLEHLTQEQEEWRTMMIVVEFPRGLENSVTTFMAVVRAWGSLSQHCLKMDMSIDPISRSTLTTLFQLQRDH
jgi:hypothetical protein